MNIEKIVKATFLHSVENIFLLSSEKDDVNIENAHTHVSKIAVFLNDMSE